MKKLFSCMLALVMVFASFSMPARAQQDALTLDAYIDGAGKARVTLDGSSESELPFDAVRDIVCLISPMTVVLTAETAEGSIGLYVYSPIYSTQNSTIQIDMISGEAVYVARDNAVYYLPAANSRRLMKYDLQTMQSSFVRMLISGNCTLSEAMDGLYITMQGPWKAYYGRILDAKTGMLRPAQFDPMASWSNFGEFETQVTAEGGLELRMLDSTEWKQVTPSEVTATAAWDGKLLYLTQEGDVCVLMRYDPETAQSAPVALLSGQFQPIMLAQGGAVYLLSDAGVAASIDLESGKITASWNTGVVADASLAIYNEKLLVYGATAVEEAVGLRAMEALPKPEKKAYGRLAVGSRGDAVRELQSRLNELGFACGSVDGIFGPKTQEAVIYFEDALGAKQDGVASAQLQEKLFADDAPRFSEFIELTREGRTGIRVRKMQERLRELGYLADAADGIYGSRTQSAVALFQTENGLRVTGTASVETLRRVMRGDAPSCSSYILLKKGDTGIRVTELQNRLKALGYYAGSVTSAFDDATVDALKLFCQTANFTVQAEADEAIQKKLFSNSAPVFTGYVELKYGDSGERVLNLQKRLAELGYFDGQLGGNFRSITRESVRLFQENHGLTVTGIATVETQEKLFAPDAKAYVKPTPEPTTVPTPTVAPTTEPTMAPTATPTTAPTATPTMAPTATPTTAPTATPTTAPTATPTPEPTATPTPEPTATPTPEPTATPTPEPTATPTPEPTATPTPEQTATPTPEPTATPTPEPTATPTPEPTATPTPEPTATPTPEPTATPTPEPTATPTPEPTATPTPEPTATPTPNEQNVDETVIEALIKWLTEQHPHEDPAVLWDKNSAVQWLQEALIAQKYLVLEPNATPSGIYDLATKQAVEALQRDKQLDKDPELVLPDGEEYPYGIVDAKTLETLWTLNETITPED